MSLGASLLGLDASPVRVEVQASRGVPSFELVGLAEAAVRESRVRVKSALAQVGIELSEYRIIVNLAPADERKFGSGFDLAIAASTMVALGVVPPQSVEGILFLGELALGGGVHGVRGVLPKLLGLRRLVRGAIVPRANEHEAALVTGLDVRVVETLGQLREALAGRAELPYAHEGPPAPNDLGIEDLADVRGQSAARRALEIAAAGSHNLLFIGPPGAGKTMLARRMGSILPPLTASESLEVTAIHSVAGVLGASRALVRARPFRAPHHSTSEAGLVGGGDVPRPGEVSLSHHGVLFLDELPEFRRGALESLRQPLEDGSVTVSRAMGRATFPARPLLVAAMNPCACGFHGDPSGRCECPLERVRAYRARLSGPLLDRIDLHVRLPPVSIGALRAHAPGEASTLVRERVHRARIRQRDRQRAHELRASLNAFLAPRDAERVCRLGQAAEKMLASAAERLGLSARAHGKVIRVARTIADLAEDLPVRYRSVSPATRCRSRPTFTSGAARAEFDGRLLLASAPAFAGDRRSPARPTRPRAAAGRGASPAKSPAAAIPRAGRRRHPAGQRGARAARRKAGCLALGERPALDAELKAKSLNFDALLRRDKETFASPSRAARAFAALAGRALRRDAPLAQIFAEARKRRRLSRRARAGQPRRHAFGARRRGAMRLMLSSGLPGHRPLLARRRAGARRGADLPRPRRGRGRRFLRARRLGRRGRSGTRRAARDARRGAAAGPSPLRRRRAFARGLRRARPDAEVGRSHFDGGLVYRLPSADERGPALSRPRHRRARHRRRAQCRGRARLARRFRSRFPPEGRHATRRPRRPRHGAERLARRARAQGGAESSRWRNCRSPISAAPRSRPRARPRRPAAGRGSSSTPARLDDFAALLARAAPGALTRWLQAPRRRPRLRSRRRSRRGATGRRSTGRSRSISSRRTARSPARASA